MADTLKAGLVCSWVDPTEGETYRLLASTPAPKNEAEYYLQVLKHKNGKPVWVESPFNGRGAARCLAHKMHLDLQDLAGPSFIIPAYPNFSDLE